MTQAPCRGGAQRRLDALQDVQAAGHTSHAQVRLVFQGIGRTLGAAPQQKQPAITAEVRAMLETLDLETLSGVRSAVLLVCFAGAFRRSELVSLDVGDMSFTIDGLVVQLRHSKVGLPFGSNPRSLPVVRRYIRDGSLFDVMPPRQFGL